ncbi:MAG: thioredoxin family protein [Deltaproteobacteria bacterium]
MKPNRFKIAVILYSLSLLVIFARPVALFAAAPPEVPVKGMVTMLDLGAKTCIPCKMMAPILEKLSKKYAGRAAVIFLDVQEDNSLIKRFGLSAIPTQIFFDKESKGVLRHRGFMSEDAIVEQFEKMGVK